MTVKMVTISKASKACNDDTCIQASAEIDLDRKKKKKSQDLGGNRTHDNHNSGVSALPVEVPSPWVQGDGELGICIQVLLVPIYG